MHDVRPTPRPGVKRAWWAASLATVLAVVSACGMMAPIAPSALMATSPAFDTLGSASPITVNFNETYGETIAANEPAARRSAHNTDKMLFQLLRGAKETLDGAFYDIEDLDVAQAFIDAKQRGVKIRLVTDTDNLVDKTDPSKPREAIVRLKKAGIPIVDDKRSAIMHHKFLVVDQKVVWTGSTNLTPTSLYCHNNNAMTIRVDAIAQAFTTEFERLFVKKEFGMTDRGRVAPLPPFQVGNMEIRLFFSPGGGGREAAVAELAAAKKSIDFMTFSLTDADIGKTILARAKAGIKVSGVFDRWLAAGQYSLFDPFNAAHLNVLRDGNEALMHHKVIIVDGSTVMTGSYNYSQNAEMNNNEAFFIIKRAPTVADAFEGEFDRVQHAAKVNHPPPYKKPDAEHKTGEGP